MALSDLTWPRHTRRLTVRPVTVEDAPALWAWHRLPEMSQWTPRLNDDLEKFTAHLDHVQDRVLVAAIDDQLQLHRVVAECFAENAASVAIMERIGMRREAHYRANSLHRDGTWRDSLVYAVLAAEWSAANSAVSIK